ncbi:permease [Pseudorhodoplanes sinuspersici]|uniref:Uncharacterized protein n=1 Tax=Pseudorhodoplanes sinuspersici TaxID=1235591 RepID=A0A1W6ZRZ0_9HYPH|nr:permease [Pseudorhodoplanes sinuspersici]ARP99870.1 hypothetical protein CAK95_12845 [Pseudorhodoplanes sinuspersici]RKE70884.1 putative permease [Pseudorhodoplanes sinuspersici]
MGSQTSQPLRRKRRAIDWPTAILIVIVGSAASYVYWRDGPAKFLDVVWNDTDLFISMLPKVLAGCLTAAFLAILLPRETINRWVGADSGFKGILVSTFAGVILPGGPFTIFPIAAAFVGMGADIAAAVTLITSWTLIGLNRVVTWEMPFLGFDFVAWRWVVALPLPILAGLFVRAIEKRLKTKASAS